MPHITLDGHEQIKALQGLPPVCTQPQGGHSLLSPQDTAERLFFQFFSSSCTQESLLGRLGLWALSTQDGIAGTGKTLTHSSFEE